MLNLLSNTIQPSTFFAAEKGIQLFRLINKNGIEAVVTNYGIRLVSLYTPDKDGAMDDIVLGYDTLHEFETKNPFMNAIIGRVANRIANGKFAINGEQFEVNTNLGKHCLHGGANGLHMQIWEVKSANDRMIHFYHHSKSGSEGFPGNLQIDVSMELTDEDELKINYWVNSDRPTPVNLTYHPYFNLTGSSSEQIVNHLLQIPADKITENDKEDVATGNFIAVDDSPFDFRMAKPIGQNIADAHPLIKNCGGYDHNFVLQDEAKTIPFMAAKMTEPNNGRTLEVWTTQPGLQLYTSNGVNDIGKGNVTYGNHSAVCLEPQHFPNSPNISHFPSILLSKEKTYTHQCIFKFGVAQT